MKSQDPKDENDWKREFVTWVSALGFILSIILCAQLNCWLENRRDRARSVQRAEDFKKA